MEILPFELHQEIFSLVTRLPWPWTEYGPSDEYHPGAPYKLAGVSRLWRQISLDTPDLWTFIHFCGTVTESQRRIADLNLERSKEHPIDVVIEGKDENEPAHTALLLVAPHIRRWGRCFLTIPGVVPLETTDMFSKPMSALTELITLSEHGRYSSLVFGTQDQSFHSYLLAPLNEAPILRRLEAHGIAMAPMQPLVSLEVLNFSLRNRQDDIVWDMLAMTPALVELNIFFPRNYSWRRESESLDRDILLTRLRRFSIYGFWGDRDSAWTTRLRMPAVDTLTISIESCDYMHPVISGISATLRKLIITSVETAEFGYLCDVDGLALRTLNEFRFETLELRDLPLKTIDHHDASFFEYLTSGQARVPGDKPPLWASRFQRLILRNCEFWLRGCQTMASFVHARYANAEAFPFSLELVGTSLVRETITEPAWMDEARPYFKDAVVERLPEYEPEPEHIPTQDLDLPVVHGPGSSQEDSASTGFESDNSDLEEAGSHESDGHLGLQLEDNDGLDSAQTSTRFF